MKRSIICMIAIIAGMAACMPEYKPNYPIYGYTDVVVVVTDPTTSLPVIITTEDIMYYVPSLLEKIDFHEGDYYLVAFKYDVGKQEALIKESGVDGVAIASDFEVLSTIQKVATTTVENQTEVADDYNESIAKISYIGTIASCHFFECIQLGAEKQTYAYEAIYVPELSSDRKVTVYIRAKKTEQVLTSSTTVQSAHYIGVDIASLKSFYRENGFKRITVTYKRKSGDDVNGEIYDDIDYENIDL